MDRSPYFSRKVLQEINDTVNVSKGGGGPRQLKKKRGSSLQTCYYLRKGSIDPLLKSSPAKNNKPGGALRDSSQAVLRLKLVELLNMKEGANDKRIGSDRKDS